MSIPQKPIVLIVDDDPSALALLERHLLDAGYQVHKAENGARALEVLRETPIRLIITDWMMPEIDGLELCRAVRSAEGIGFIYVIILTAHADRRRLVEAFDDGADDFLSKPFDRHELLARLRAGKRIVELEAGLAERSRTLHRVNAEMAILNAKLERMATTDELTGLVNRRQAVAKLGEQWASAERYGHPLSCIMLDIDHFKKFNDRYGHATGDLVLKEIATVMIESARGTDTCGRLGGEEFVVLCPNVDAAGAEACAERIRSSVASHRVNYQEQDLAVTASLGVADRDDGMTGPDDLLRAADEALYAAKDAGRNRVQVATRVAAKV